MSDAPARVTRVRSRRQDRDPLPPTVWRRHLRALARAMLIVTVVMLAAGLFVGVAA